MNLCGFVGVLIIPDFGKSLIFPFVTGLSAGVDPTHWELLCL
jgi:hypothetical protein